ncbi:cell adhesion molecule 3-like [Macrobrachium rosenbergii]|uniref:cell adhesion molecule 3-like n=1 Tax=Macrobrachium rosenbergii TaxID=79674 RepID=UPI0034D53ABD
MVTWWEGAHLLDNASEVTSGQVTSNDLHHPPLTREDFNKSLRCVASNSDLTTPLSVSVEIDMHYPPTSVVLEGGAPRVTLKEGVARRVTCQVIGSRPAAKVNWRGTDGRSLPGAQETVVEDILQDGTTRSILTILPSQEDDGGTLECSGSNPSLPKVVLRNTTHLSVLYKPQMTLGPEEGSSLGDLREGADVTLKCSVRANPEVLEVQWALNGVPLQETPGEDLKTTRDVLSLRNIDRSSSGNYTCAAANTEGASTSDPLLG